MADKPSSKQRRSEGRGTDPGDAAEPANREARGASGREADKRAALAAERAAKRAEAKEARKVGLDDDGEDRPAGRREGGSTTAEKATKWRKLGRKGSQESAQPSPRQAARSGNPRKAAQARAEPSRYTPPIPSSERSSPWWVPTLMFASFILGILIIFLNYVEVPFGAAVTWRTLLGLGFILVGIMTATQYH